LGIRLTHFLFLLSFDKIWLVYGGPGFRRILFEGGHSDDLFLDGDGSCLQYRAFEENGKI
jgi:hypothetical protein